MSPNKQEKALGSQSLPHAPHIGRQSRPFGDFQFLNLWGQIFELGSWSGVATTKKCRFYGIFIGVIHRTYQRKEVNYTWKIIQRKSVSFPREFHFRKDNSIEAQFFTEIKVIILLFSGAEGSISRIHLTTIAENDIISKNNKNTEEFLWILLSLRIKNR